MTRRLLGLVTVLAVVVSALVVGRWLGPDLAGTARPAPLAAPPEVGDCLLDPAGDLLSINERQTGQRAPATPTTPCTGDRFGEVVRVIADPLAVAVAPGVGEEVQDTAATRCLSAGAEYLGMTVSDAGWTPELLYYVGFVGPDERQRTAGQNWLACVVRPARLGDDPTAPPAPYPGSLREAAGTGLARDRTGRCTEPDDPLTLVACSSPHRSEVLGTAIADGRPLDSWKAACAAWAGDATDLTDPTAGGALRTVVTVHDSSGALVTGSTIPDGSRLECSITTVSTDQLLVDSLRAWGSDPLPWQ